MQIKKTSIIQSTILTATLFLNSGCFFGYFGQQLVPTEKESNVVATQQPLHTEPVRVTREIPSAPIITKATAPVIAPIVTKATAPVIAPISIEVPTNFPKSNLPTSSLECTDDINSGCEKELVKPSELKTPIKTNSGGEIHNLRTVTGKAITVEERSNGFIFPEYAGKIVILEMFGKNCAHCIKEIPTLNRLRQKYGSNLEIIAVQVEDKMSPSEAKRLIRRHNIHYPIVTGDTATNLQYNIQTTYGWTGILPFTMIVKDGVTEMSHKGEVSYRELNKNIRSLLQ